MKPNRFTEAQILKILEEAEAGSDPVAEIARRHGRLPVDLLPLAQALRRPEPA